MLWLALVALPSLAYAVRPGVSPSRRLLAGVLVAVVPIVGLALAIVARRATGGGVALEPDLEDPEPSLSPVDVARLSETPSVLDRLLTGDAAERLEALVALSSAGDASAVAVLRWAIEHGPSDVVLDAALTLEEIELRCDAKMAATREMLAGATENADLALDAARASAYLVVERIADPVIAPQLAEQARSYFQLAREWAPDRADEIDVELARLELAAGRPRDALALLDRLSNGDTEVSAHIVQLRDAAAFAAREFTALSFAPCALEVPPDLQARKLQTMLS